MYAVINILMPTKLDRKQKLQDLDKTGLDDYSDFKNFNKYVKNNK